MSNSNRTLPISSKITVRKSSQNHDGVSLPYHARLVTLFNEIEKEFALLYDENQELKRRLQQFETDEGISSTFIPSIATSTNSNNQPVEVVGEVHMKAHVNDNSSSRIKSSTKQRVKKSLYRSQWQKHREFVGHRDGVGEVSVSPSRLNTFASASADRTARIWHMHSSQFLFSYVGHKGSVNSVRFHPTEALVCSASGDQTCHIWRIPPVALKTIEQFNILNNETRLLRSESFDSSDPSNQISEITSLSSKTPLFKLQGHTDAVMAADWLVGGKRLVSGGWDMSVALWELGEAAAVKLQSFAGHDQRINNIVTHPSEVLALSSSRDQSFRLWDFRKPSVLVSAVQGHSSSVASAVFSKNGSYVVSSSDRAIKVWDLKYMKAPVTLIRQTSSVNRISVSPVVSTIAAPLDNGDVYLFDLSGGLIAKIPRSSKNHSKAVCSTAWSNDESRLISSGWTEDVFSWGASH